MKKREYRFPSKAFLNGEGKEEAASPPQKEANPASLRSAAPSKGRGSRGHSLLPMEGGAPKGRRLEGGSGMKKSVEIVSSAPLYESTRAPSKKENQPCLAALGSPFQGKGLAWTLPPSYGRRCPEGAEVGWGKRYEKDRERSSQVGDIREHPIHRCAVPLPQWGRLRYEDTAFLNTTPSLMEKAKRRRLHRTKRKPTPPRCARQPLPREGARVDTPSFLWKEVPRRGGGWMGEAG